MIRKIANPSELKEGEVGYTAGGAWYGGLGQGQAVGLSGGGTAPSIAPGGAAQATANQARVEAAAAQETATDAHADAAAAQATATAALPKPGAAVEGHLPVFDGGPGAVRDSGCAPADFALVGHTHPASGGTSLSPGVRLSLQSGVPVSTTDQLARTTIYAMPYGAPILPLYEGGAWVPHSFETELTLAVPATANTLYDLFIFDNSGTLTLQAVAWATTSARATALARQNGYWVMNGAADRLYVGSVLTTAVAGQTEDSQAKRYLWNAFNRHRRSLSVTDETGHNYNSTTWRGWNNAVVQVSWVQGVLEDVPVAHLTSRHNYENSSVGWGLNGGTPATPYNINGGTISRPLPLSELATPGFHWLAVREKSGTGGTAYFYAVYGYVEIWN